LGPDDGGLEVVGVGDGDAEGVADGLVGVGWPEGDGLAEGPGEPDPDPW
jgi:hypothetical protein